MEGWLLVPPERNIMGRGGTWKNRYVVFGRDAPQPARAMTAVDRRSINALTYPHASINLSEVCSSISLSIYKEKNQGEPISRYSVQDIASCSIEDLEVKQKKQSTLPTLIIHLRVPEKETNSPRAFRRRSHDTQHLSRSTQPALLFRPVPEDPDCLEKWAQEIQFWLNTVGLVSNSARRGVGSQLDSSVPGAPHTATSLFFAHGEPSTALLSPSLRSKCSDLSSIASDRRSISSSSLSELPSPRAENPVMGFSKMASNSARPDIRQTRDQVRTASTKVVVNSSAMLCRETILDRYFSSIPTPSSAGGSISSSIERFEALMRDTESRGENIPKEKADEKSIFGDGFVSNGIPTATLRALQFISTGIKHPEDESPKSSRAASLVIPEINERRSSSLYTHSRRNSTSSMGATSAAGSSFGGTSHREGSVAGSLGTIGGQLSYSSTGKRHSISDFSYNPRSSSTSFPGRNHSLSRPGSVSEFKMAARSRGNP